MLEFWSGRRDSNPNGYSAGEKMQTDGVSGIFVSPADATLSSVGLRRTFAQRKQIGLAAAREANFLRDARPFFFALRFRHVQVEMGEVG